MSRLVLDLSRNNARPNFVRLKRAGVEGVILKTTEGANYEPAWDSGMWAPYARRAGLRVGFYHFARPSGGDAVAEARNFAHIIKIHGGCQRRDFRPALDMEATKIDHERLYAWSRAFNQEIRNQGLPTPMFYTYPYFLREVSPPQPIGNGLWFASYTGVPGKVGHSFAPWRKVHLHQYTSIGYVRDGDYIYPPKGSDGRRHLDKNYIMSLTALLAHPILGQV
jgi:lysozyme